MTSQILLVSIDYSLFKQLETCLGMNFMIHLSPTLQDGIPRLVSDIYDLNILDVQAEEHSRCGELVGDLFQCRPCPTIVLAHFQDAWGRIRAIDQGAVCCFTKPVLANELAACVRAQLRPYLRARQTERPLTYQELVLYTVQRKVFLSGTSLSLSARQFDILHYLLVNQELACTSERIYSEVWKDRYDYEYGSNCVTCQISILRKKLAPHGEYIKTLFNYGYQI